MTKSEREAVRAILRNIPSYKKEVDFLRGATLDSIKVRLKATQVSVGGSATAAWMGSVRVVSGKQSRTIRGHGRSPLRFVGPNVGPGSSPGVPLAYGLDPADAVRQQHASDAAKEVTVHTGLSAARLADFARRALVRDCAQDLLRLAREIDQQLLDPARRDAAEQVLALETRIAAAEARQKRMNHFLSYLLPQAVTDGLEQEEILTAFDTIAVEQVMDS